MIAASIHPLHGMRVRLARAHQRIGWAGLAGLGLIVAALWVLGLAWSARNAFLQAEALREVAALTATAPAAMPAIPVAAPASAPDLPRLADVPLLLTQMEQAALGNGLAWRAAEYRITAATPARPASLEVRCSIGGTYPKLRSMLVQLMNTVPAFTIREFSTSRPSSESADIEARLLLAVFLLEDASGFDTPPAKATP